MSHTYIAPFDLTNGLNGVSHSSSLTDSDYIRFYRFLPVSISRTPWRFGVFPNNTSDKQTEGLYLLRYVDLGLFWVLMQQSITKAIKNPILTILRGFTVKSLRVLARTVRVKTLKIISKELHNDLKPCRAAGNKGCTLSHVELWGWKPRRTQLLM